MNDKIIPSYFISHGWWPWNVMWEAHMRNTWEIDLKNYLNNLWQKYTDVKAVVVVTAHWEESKIWISFVEDYSLLYDYYGFPVNTYDIDYRVKWDIEIAWKIEQLLSENWIKSFRETKRGLDHWSFVPLMEMYPNMNIPVVQISISNNLNAKFHFNLWKALSSLKKENILILWSWMSYHNMSWLFSNDKSYRNDSVGFDEFIQENINNPEILFNWDKNILWLKSHPRPDHLMPFFTILWTNISWEISQDCKMNLFGKEIVWYKVK